MQGYTEHLIEVQARIYGTKIKKYFSQSIRNPCTEFQAKVHVVITMYFRENLRRKLKKKTLILSNSAASLKAIDSIRYILDC